MSNVDLMNLIQGNIHALKPYHVENIDCDVKLHANENPFPPSEELLETFTASIRNFQLNRYPDPDSKKLKDSIAKRLNTDTSRLVIGNGSDEIILLLLQVFCSEGDSIIFPDPTFAMYAIIAKGLGVKPVNIPLNDHWDFDADELLKVAEHNKSRIIFLSYPNNPTGNCFSENQVRKVVENFSGIVVVDEAYYDFARKSFVGEINKHNNLVVLRSLSKIGLAGLRVGFGVADPLIIDQINKVRLPYNSNTVSQTLAEYLITHFDPVQKQIDSILDERVRLMGELEKMDSLTVFPSDSNFFLFRTEQSADKIFRYLIDNGILIRNLSSHPRLNNCLRITVGTRGENDQFLSKMADYAQIGNP
ncbi:MAG: histidinol-phosphate transaminase [Nitrospinae bacterium]|nr:histidinol-phosphate transaminase [Nitrospinota bacterium]|tara:strand:+ start:882 stop:1964 length:1083 start_codon:yes stop_codon:yes gene_type:complete